MSPWPLWDLTLSTPRLQLQPDDDAGLAELVAVAQAGVHPPGEMPFGVPWSAAPGPELAVQLLRHHWTHRATLCPSDWHVSFLVRHGGAVIGVQSLAARDFAATRVVRTGSWLGLAHQGQGFGTEMRAAVLSFAFGMLGASVARSSAFVDNVRSLRVSRRLGYSSDGVEHTNRAGAPAVQERLSLTAERFAALGPSWPLLVAGAGPCLALLGVTPQAPGPSGMTPSSDYYPGKLVRDRIPQVIREGGAEPVVYVAGATEYSHRLRDKLSEELAEFLAADEKSAPEELADVLEVVHALAADLGIGVVRLEQLREAKAHKRGGFAGRIIWLGNR